ncbi:MAG: hypothetical protein ACLSCY_02645 [Clostridium sp.]
MFEEIIEFDEKKIKERNLDINKINAYLDEIHDVPEIKKKRDGHYVGVTCSTELARFGNAIWCARKQNGFVILLKDGNFGKMANLKKIL